MKQDGTLAGQNADGTKRATALDDGDNSAIQGAWSNAENSTQHPTGKTYDSSTDTTSGANQSNQ